MLPNLNTRESGDKIRRDASLRSTDQLVAALDLAYCLHWAVVDAELHGDELVGLYGMGVRERRHALEWLLNEDDEWDDVPLDT